MTIKAILFDMDGVIVDTEWIGIVAAGNAFKEMGISLTKEELDTIYAKHPMDYLPAIVEKHGVDINKAFEALRFHYYDQFDQLKLFEGIKEFLQNVKDKGFKTALVTSSDLKAAKEVFERFNIGNFFDVIITFDDCTERKPSPEPYLTAAEKLEVTPDACVVIEDSHIGIASAKRAGMRCIQFKSERYTVPEHEDAYLVVKSFSDIDLNRLSEL